MLRGVNDSKQKQRQRMTEKHWCVHEVDVLKVRNNYVYLLGVQIHWRESRSNHV